MLKIVGSVSPNRPNRVWTVIRLTAYSLLGAGLVVIGSWGPPVVRTPGWWVAAFGATYLLQALVGTVRAVASPPKDSGR
jgi:membrane protein YdbS with pleckstrin-like domain